MKQNVLEESTLGAIGTFGDPSGAEGSYLVGVDGTFQTSRFQGSKNFIAGAWGMVTDREGLEGDKTAFGAKIDYPNDVWDIALTYIRIGEDFNPAMGFVPRRGIHKLNGGINYRYYAESLPWMRYMYYEFMPTVVWDLAGKWESYRLEWAMAAKRMVSGQITW